MASDPSEFKRTLYVRHLNEANELVERGPFHHTHIRDLIDAKALPLDFEVRSEVNPKWIHVREHSICPLVVPHRVKYAMQHVPDTVNVSAINRDPENDTYHATEILWGAMSEDDKAQYQRHQGLKEYEARGTSQIKSRLRRILLVLCPIGIVYAWLGYISGIFIALDRSGLSAFFGNLYTTVPGNAGAILLPTVQVGEAMSPLYAAINNSSLFDSSTGLTFLAGLIGGTFIVVVFMLLGNTSKKWGVACAMSFFWLPIPVVAVFDAVGNSMAGILVFPLVAGMAFYLMIFLAYKTCFNRGY
jgi:hypothetical protein